jgi:hypothetical protein
MSSIAIGPLKIRYSFPVAFVELYKTAVNPLGTLREPNPLCKGKSDILYIPTPTLAVLVP